MGESINSVMLLGDWLSLTYRLAGRLPFQFTNRFRFFVESTLVFFVHGTQLVAVQGIDVPFGFLNPIQSCHILIASIV